MLTTPHLLFGAAIGVYFDKPLYIVPLAAASHFVLDSVPHLQGYIDVEDVDKKDWMILLADTILGVALVALLAFTHPQTEAILIGALCAWLPDFHHLYQKLFGPEKLSRYDRLHKKFHWKRDIRFLPGIATQIVVIALSLLTMVKR